MHRQPEVPTASTADNSSAPTSSATSGLSPALQAIMNEENVDTSDWDQMAEEKYLTKDSFGYGATESQLANLPESIRAMMIDEIHDSTDPYAGAMQTTLVEDPSKSYNAAYSNVLVKQPIIPDEDPKNLGELMEMFPPDNADLED